MKPYSIKIERFKLPGFLLALDVPATPTTENYVSHYFETDEFTLKIYENTKHHYVKAVVTGTLPLRLKMYYELTEKQVKKEIPVNKIKTYPQIGSDEVGFGDFFGPLVVVSALVTKTDLAKLSLYKITDSKKLSDEYILQIGPLLINEFSHRKNIVNNEKFNSLISEGYNMNKMKAMLHVNVLSKLGQKENVSILLLDRFVAESTFNDYVQDLPKVKVTHVADGEANSLSIALASVIARYYFLTEIGKINERYRVIIPLGAGEKVDEFAFNFVNNHGKSALLRITKHNFKNFKRLFEALQ